MRLAKLENDRPRYCPQTGMDTQGRYHTNLPRYYEKRDPQDRDGWLEVVYTDKPAGDYTDVYEIADGRIVQRWQAFDPQPEPVDPVAQRLDMIEECLLEISEVIYA